MDKKLTGVQSIGIKLPIIREGDDLVNIVVNSVLTAIRDYDEYYDRYIYDIDDKDVIGITESIVARSQGNYVTIDDIVEYLESMHISKNLILYSPIMSRNRFSMILKAFARYADSIEIICEGKYDEQGNPNEGINPFTGVDIKEYYHELCESENCKFEMHMNQMNYYYQRPQYYLLGKKWMGIEFGKTFIDCRCHPEEADQFTLKDIMNHPVNNIVGYNSEYGLLGSNKATEEKLKLFPEPAEAQQFVEEIKQRIFKKTGKHVVVCVYGDGCFHSPALNGMPGINEFADPVPMPAYTDKDIIEGCPNEGKLKYYADLYPEKTIDELIELLHQDKGENSVGKMTSEGCTPRRRDALLASLMDLTSGSGDRATPVCIIKGYI